MSTGPTNPSLTSQYIIDPIKKQLESKSPGALLGVHSTLQELNSFQVTRTVSLKELKKFHELEAMAGKPPTSPLGQLAEFVSAVARALLGQGFKSARQLIREELSILRSSTQLDGNIEDIKKDFKSKFEELCETTDSNDKIYENFISIIDDKRIDLQLKIDMILFLEEALAQVSETPNDQTIKARNKKVCLNLLGSLVNKGSVKAATRSVKAVGKPKGATQAAIESADSPIEHHYKKIKDFIRKSGDFSEEKKTAILKHLEIIYPQYKQLSNEDFSQAFTEILARKGYKEFPNDLKTLIESKIPYSAKKELLTQIRQKLTGDENNDNALISKLRSLALNTNPKTTSVNVKMIREAFTPEQE